MTGRSLDQLGIQTLSWDEMCRSPSLSENMATKSCSKGLLKRFNFANGLIWEFPRIGDPNIVP